MKRGFRRAKLTLLASGFVLASALGAETDNSADRAVNLPVVEVSTSPLAPLTVLTPAESALRLTFVPGGAQLIGNAEMNNGCSGNFLDLLNHASGIVLETDNAGEAEKISIRGSGIQSDDPLGVELLVDGLPYNQGDGEANLEEMDLGAIKAAEIYRGANALRYGSYVLGGAINLLSRTGRDSPGASFSLQGGSFGYLRAQASWGQATNTSDAFADLSARRTDGFREHSAEDAEVFSLNAGFRYNQDAENRIYFSASRWARLIPGDLDKSDVEDRPTQASDDAVDENFRTRTDSERIADIFTANLTNGQLEAGGYFHHRHFLIYDLYAADFRKGVTVSHSDNLGGNFTWTSELEVAGVMNYFLVGTAPTGETERSRNFKNDAGKIDRGVMTADFFDQSLNVPLFFEDRIAVTSSLSIDLGLQASFIQRKFTDFENDGTGHPADTQNFHGINPKIGVIDQLAPKTQLFANLSRSFQPPSIDDLTPFQAGEEGGVQYTPLAAQRAWTTEVGTRSERGRIEWSLSVYESEWRNELLELNDAAGHSLGTVNAGHTRHAGIEAGATLSLLPHEPGQPSLGWSLQIDYLLNDFRFQNDPVYGNNRIGGIPVQMINVELMYRAKNGFYCGPNIVYSCQRYPADEANTLFANAYSLWGAKMGLQRPRYTLFLEFRNLSNSRYVSMVKPIADARVADDDDLQLFSPGEPRNISSGFTISW